MWLFAGVICHVTYDAHRDIKYLLRSKGVIYWFVRHHLIANALHTVPKIIRHIL